MTQSLVGKVVYADGRYPYAAAAAYEPGDVIVRPDGTLAFFDGFEGCASGDRINPEPIAPSKVVQLPADTADTWAAGTLLFWSAADEEVTATPGANKVVGVAVAAKTSGQLTALVNVLVIPRLGHPINIRTRFTIAQVNAGATIVAAEAGIKYRMINAAMIAVGGAAAAHTTIDILATLSASSRKLVAFAVAQTAQSTLLQPGITGAAILADGASYTANDVNTAITVGKTGSDITTATHIDVMLTYVREVA